MKTAGCVTLAFLVLGTSVRAADAVATRIPISMVAPVQYADDAAAKGVVRENCALEKAVEEDMLKALRAQGRSVDTATSSASGRTLEVTIERVEGLGGGSFTGNKTLSLKARVRADGKVVHSTMSSYYSKGFPLGTTCYALQKDSAHISVEFARWLDAVDSADAARLVAPTGPSAPASGAGS